MIKCILNDNVPANFDKSIAKLAIKIRVKIERNHNENGSNTLLVTTLVSQEDTRITLNQRLELIKNVADINSIKHFLSCIFNCILMM